MDNSKNNEYYVRKILSDLRFILEHTAGLTQTQLERDEVLADSVMFRLIQISENADKLTEDFKKRHAWIAWHAMRGLRNRIVHEYGNVDLGIVFDTVKNDLPKLLEWMEKIES